MYNVINNVSNLGIIFAVSAASGCLLLPVKTTLLCYLDPLLKVLDLLCVSEQCYKLSFVTKIQPFSSHLVFPGSSFYLILSLFLSSSFLLSLYIISTCLYIYAHMHINANIHFLLFCGYFIKLSFSKTVLLKVMLLFWESMSPISVLHQHYH